MPRLLGGLIDLRCVGGDEEGGGENRRRGPQQPGNPGAASYAAYLASNGQDFAPASPHFDDQPQCHCHGHQSNHYDPGSGSSYYYSHDPSSGSTHYYSQYTQQSPPGFAYNQQDGMYGSSPVDEQPTCHRRGHRHGHSHPSQADSSDYFGQNSQQPPYFAYGQEHHMQSPPGLDDQPTCQGYRRRHRHRPSHRHRHHHHHDHHQGQGARQPPLPPGFGTDQAVILVPMPDGSVMAQPANYWQDGQHGIGRSGH